MLPRVYVETSIPSLYHDVRTSPAVVARRDWTRQWWSDASTRYNLLSSAAVIDELAAGTSALGALRLELVRTIPLLPIEPPIIEIVTAYIQHKVMPGDPAGDALHLAIASFYKGDFLLTWNCRHLANANKFGHIRRVNALLGLFVPALVTPLELLGGDDDTSNV